MKPSTREWVVKAEEDYLAAVDLSRRRKRPLWSGVCFHAQQCAEKYLKARMEEASLAIPRTHDLEVLLFGLEDVNVLSLRAAWHMENLLANIPMIQAQKLNGSAARAARRLRGEGGDVVVEGRTITRVGRAAAQVDREQAGHNEQAQRGPGVESGAHGAHHEINWTY